MNIASQLSLRPALLLLAAFGALAGTLTWGAADASATIGFARGKSVYVAENDGTGVRKIGSLKKSAERVFYVLNVAPDGEHVAALSVDSGGAQIVVLQAKSGAAAQTTTLPFKRPLSVDWLDGQTLIVSTRESRSNDIYRVSIAPGAGKPSRLARIPFRPCGKQDEPGSEGFSCGSRITDLTASPDGTRIAVTGPSGSTALRVLTAAGKQLFARGGSGNGVYQVVGAAFSPDASNTLLTSELPNSSNEWRITTVSNTGKRKAVYATKGIDPSVGSSVAWSSDAKLGAFITYKSILSDDPKVYIWDRATGKAKAVGPAFTERQVEYIAGFVDPTHAIVVGNEGAVSTLDVTTGTLRSILGVQVASLDVGVSS